MFRLRIHKSVFGKYNFVQTHMQFKPRSCLERFKWVVNDKKLDNNIARAKSNIFNIVNYNRFTYFYTQTISPLYARTDLKRLISKFNEYTRYLRKKYPNEQFFYLVIPEYHKDKQNWHLHGFLSSGYSVESYVNDNGFLSMRIFDKIGFNSISKIRNYDAACKYITKYITKDIAKDIIKGDKLFYCSQKLLRQNVVGDYGAFDIAPIHFDFKSDYVFKTSVSEDKYYNFITDIDNIERFYYYLIK